MRISERRLRWSTLAVAVVLASVFAGVTAASAQADRGTIQGLVTDQSGGVVPGARVEVTHAATGVVLTVTTNGEGSYRVPNVPLGAYRVIIDKTGFSPAVAEGLDIRAGIQIRVDMVLQPLGLTETVSVTASNLDASAISNSTALSEKLIADLPVIKAGTKRGITGFLANLPGFTGGGEFVPRANGANVGDTDVYLDGARSSQLIQRGAFEEVGPQLEQVGEFSVVSNGFNAEYGGFGIWFSNVTIKSGTNRFSGSVFDHFGTEKLNAKTYFQVAKTGFKQHEGGFTLGGPVVLPGYDGRNRTFFFGSLGLFFSRVGASGNLATVATDAFKAGDFSGLVDAQGRQITIYDPATTRPDGAGGFVRDPFPGNRIPANRISPGALAILGFLPSPDLPGNINNFGLRSSPTWPFYDIYTPMGKVDHRVSDSQRLSVTFTRQIRHRVIWSNGMGPAPEWGATQENPIDNQFDQLANSYKVRVNHDHVFSARMVNHVTVSVDRYNNRGQNKTAGQGWLGKLGVAGIPDDDGAFPQINFQGGTAAPAALNRAYDESWNDMTFGVNQSLTMTAGTHTLKFGGEAARAGVDRFFSGGRAGTFTFSNFSTSQINNANQGNAFASFLLGEVTSANATIPVETGIRLDRYALFAQDEWRVTPKLTLSYGLRWDYQPPFFEVDNKLTTFLPDLANPRAGGRPGALAFASTSVDQYGRSFQDNWYGGFGPRLGIGYSINPRTVLRASAGLYYNGTGNQNGSGGQILSAAGYQATPAFSSPDNYTPIFNWNTGTFPQAFVRPPVLDPSFSNGQSVEYTTRDAARLPRVVSFNIGIAREIGQGLTLDLSYIGSRSSHLGLSGNASELNYVPVQYLSLGNLLLQPITSPAAVAAGFTEPFPGFTSQVGLNTVAQSLKLFPQYNSIAANTTRLMEGRAEYDSAVIKADKRFSRGLALVSFYTWARNMSNTNYALEYPGERPLRIDSGTPTHTFSFSGTYELPLGEDRKFLSGVSGPLSAIVSGWNVAAALRYSSGSNLLITATNTLMPLGYGTKYADRVAGVDVYKDPLKGFDPLVDRYLNAAAFTAPGQFAFGNTHGPLEDVKGFTQKSESFSFSKRVRLADNKSLSVGIDITNPLNFVRWNNPNTNVSSGAQFGSVTSTQPGRQTQINATYAF